MAGTGKGWKATNRAESTERGGEHGLPRSFGLTLEAVRYRSKLNKPDMLAGLAAIPRELSPWPFPDYNSDAKNPGGAVGAWEVAQNNPSFGCLHRYGVMSGTLAGVLLIASHFYARLRDASNPKEDREKHLDEIKEIVRRLRTLCDRAEAEALGFDSNRADLLSQPVGIGRTRELHLKFINELLDAYRAE